MTHSSSIVSLENVSKSFVLRANHSVKEVFLHRVRGGGSAERFSALRNINLELPAGTTVGLVGHNGSGKSTLLKVIGGIITPDSGRAMRRGRLAALLELGAGFHPDLTGRENIYLNASILGLSRQETARQLDAIVDFAEIEQFLDNQVKFYSSGMYVRLGFAVAVHTDPDLLLVDEVLAVGDEPFQRKCIDRIREFQNEGRTIAVVSHSASQIRELCSRVVVLDHGEMKFDGDAEDGLGILSDLYSLRQTRAPHLRSDELSHESPLVIENVSSNVSRRGIAADVLVRVHYKVLRPVENWALKVSFLSSTGQIVTDVDNLYLDVKLPGEPGVYVAEYLYEDIPLGVGNYDLHVMAAAKGGVPVYHSVANAAHVSVPAGRRGGGIVKVYPQVTYAPVSDDLSSE